MNFKLGEKVRFLNEKGEGVISKIISKTTVGITIEDGFELPFQINQLVKIYEEPKKVMEEVKEPTTEEMYFDTPESANIDLNKVLFQKQKSPPQTRISKPHNKNNPASEMEINLHIEELIDDYSRMSNAQIMQIQLRHFQKALDTAHSNSCRKLIVIHGVGNGRLKQEVRTILSDENLRFHDASFSKYGFGATEVLIG